MFLSSSDSFSCRDEPMMSPFLFILVVLRQFLAEPGPDLLVEIPAWRIALQEGIQVDSLLILRRDSEFPDGVPEDWKLWMELRTEHVRVFLVFDSFHNFAI